MKSHAEIAQFLLGRMKAQGISQVDLGKSTLLAPRTLQLMLKGTRDYRLGTLFAVADRLGLELVLAPKAAAAAIQAGQTTEPAVKTRVQSALDAVNAVGAGTHGSAK